MLEVLDHPDFDVIVTADEVESSRPRRDLLECVLARTGLDPEEILVVGDSVWDMEAATCLGTPANGVATGGTSATELHDAGFELARPDLASLNHAMQEARESAAP